MRRCWMALPVGEGAKIGALSLVLVDVPPNATAVGVPERIVLTQL